MPRLERDTWVASAELVDRKVVRIAPQVTLQEMLLAFREVLSRNDMFAHHHVQREPRPLVPERRRGHEIAVRSGAPPKRRPRQRDPAP